MLQEIIADHWELVAAFNATLLLIIGWFVRRSFAHVEEHQCRQDARLEQMERDIIRLDKDLVDSKRDRLGLHAEIADGFKSLREHLTLMERGNTEAHNNIVRLIKNGHTV